MFYNNPLQEEADMISSELGGNNLPQKETVIYFCRNRLPILYKKGMYYSLMGRRKNHEYQ
jgi:hypothetical protein